jgi:glutamyl-tRNA reductase
LDENRRYEGEVEIMSISMIGIDHNMAPVDIRAHFAFTKKNAGEAMEKIKNHKGIYGCVILSTCNRLEVWASVDDAEEVCLYDCLCQLKGITEDSYKEYFVERKDKEAVEHLFYLTSGLKSQIIGEDQILTQVKDALNLARENFAADGVLEVLFRMAVTAGKRIKTEVPFSHGNPSVIHQAIGFLAQKGYSLKDKTCMVIGNGEMGKVAAQALREAGADVTVTIEGMDQLAEPLYLYDAYTRKSTLLEGDSHTLEISGESHGRYYLRSSLSEVWGIMRSRSIRCKVAR